MDKINVVLVVLNETRLSNAVACLNLNNAKPIAVLIEGGDRKLIPINNVNVPMYSFSSIEPLMSQAKNAVWAICGYVNDVSDIYKTKQFLVSNGVPEDNIVNFEILFHITSAWIANIRYIEKNPVDYFLTGISYLEAGFNLNCIPGMKGVNLASSNQDLRQSYLTAKYVFEHAAPGTIKYAFIGLTPYSLRYDNIKSFSVCPRNLQYIWILNAPADETPHGKLLAALVSDKIKAQFVNITAESADLNFDKLKNIPRPKGFPAKAITSWKDQLENLTKTFRAETVTENVQILEDYIQLCLDNGAKPIALVFPFPKAMHDNYNQELLASFRLVLKQLEKIYDFKFIDLFDLSLGYEYFYDMAHLNLNGSIAATSMFNLKLHEQNLLPAENLCQMKYSDLNILANIFGKDEYNRLADKIFKMTAEKIRQKDKVKIGFVLYDASMWCGDGIYNLFAQDERYELTIFMCLRSDKKNSKITEDFNHGVEQFKSRGLNVVALTDENAEVPKHDVMIYLTPYLEVLPKVFQLERLTAETLLAYIPYGFNISTWNSLARPLVFCSWKVFFESEFMLGFAEEKQQVGLSHGYYSGYPRLDVFFDSRSEFNFEWKMAQPDAFKIVWAPHFSINDGIYYSTFQHNYQFMYEYAKAHPETSWVLKPHPNLLFSAVTSKLFPSTEAFEEYLKKWDALPNAKVVTGAYYQDIFATSDGLILDSSSFAAEYQYTHKPTIFLTRDTQKFNDFGSRLMKVLYRVDGKNLKAIETTIEKVFIKGKDELADARRRFFDKYMNYKKSNGILASEYIFKNISEDLKKE